MSLDTELGGNPRPGSDPSVDLAEDEIDVQVDAGANDEAEVVEANEQETKTKGNNKRTRATRRKNNDQNNNDPKENGNPEEVVVIEDAVVAPEEEEKEEIDPNDIDDEEDEDVEDDEDEEDEDEEHGRFNKAVEQPMTLQDAQAQGNQLEAALAAAVASIEQLEQRKRPAAKSFMRKEPPARLRQPPAQPDPPVAKSRKRASSKKAGAPRPASAVLGDDDLDDILVEVTTNRRGTTRRSVAGVASTSPAKKKKKTATTPNADKKKTPTKKSATTPTNKKQPAKQPAAKVFSTVAKTRGSPRRTLTASTETATPKSGRKTSPLVSEGAPDDPFPGGGDWPAGWKKRVYQRQSGASKGHLDSYWYTPMLEVKLRSMVEIRRWLAAMEQTNGDEEASRLIYKTIVV